VVSGHDPAASEKAQDMSEAGPKALPTAGPPGRDATTTLPDATANQQGPVGASVAAPSNRAAAQKATAPTAK
jgi:hypothetical protein